MDEEFVPNASAEPIGPTLSNWYQPVQLLTDRRTMLYGVKARIEARVGPLLGGTLAAIALSFDRGSSTLDLILAGIYLFPVLTLFSVYRSKIGTQVPTGKAFLDEWQVDPQNELRDIAYALQKAMDDPVSGMTQSIERQAASIDSAVKWILIITSVIVVCRILEALIYSCPLGLDFMKELTVPRAFDQGSAQLR